MVKSRAFFTSAILVLTLGCAFGQSRFQIGFKAGVNFSSLTGTDPEMNESFASIGAQPFVGDFFSYQYDADFFNDAAIRFSASADASYRLTTKARLQLGIGYAGRGINLKEEGEVYTTQGNQNSQTILSGSFSYKRRVKLNYLSVPFNFKYYIGIKNRLFVTAGTYLDFLLSSKVSGDQAHRSQVSVITDGQSETVQASEGESHFSDPDAHTSKFDVGVMYGGGVEFPVNSKMNFIASLTMNHGLIKIDGKYDNETVIYPGTSSFLLVHQNYYGLNSNAKNFTVSMSVGITYQL